MKISGFTIARNAVQLRYPFLESIRSILPICDEFIVNVGKSDDTTLEAVKSLRSEKIKIIETVWNMQQGPCVLSQQTNIALSYCKGDWAFYLQSDEVVHEADLPRLRHCMAKYFQDFNVDALRFRWLHFFRSHFRYRIDRGWYQKQDRIIRNNLTVESYGDAFGFRRRDGNPLRRAATGCFIYHYGWTNTAEDMRRRQQNAAAIGYADQTKGFSAGLSDLDRFPIYFGSHPKVMEDLIKTHALSQSDWQNISRQHRWNPLLWMRARYKTSRRVKESIK
jgi:glycosyltransferase involved in cell wall biosynthesis